MARHWVRTNQKQVRMAFWENFEGINISEERRYKRKHGDFRTDIRCAFIDFVDAMQKNGEISEALAERVTLA